MDIADKIKYHRCLNDLTQQQLADKCGLSKIMITSIETKKRNPSLRTILKIYKALDIKEINSQES